MGQTSKQGCRPVLCAYVGNAECSSSLRIVNDSNLVETCAELCYRT